MAYSISKGYTPSSGQIADSTLYNTDMAALFNTLNGLQDQTTTIGGLTVQPSANDVAIFVVDNAAGENILTVDSTNGDVIIEDTGKLFFDGSTAGAGSDTYITESGADILDIYVGAANMIKLTEAATDIIQLTGNVGIGLATPASLLDIRDGSVSLTDADVIHGLTSIAPTNAYGEFAPLSGTNGGLAIEGVTDADATALEIRGTIGVTNPTDTTPAVFITGGKSNGTTSGAALGNDETVMTVRNWSTNVLSLKGDGDLWMNATTKLYLDGGSNTYISESAGDTIRFTAGATDVLSITNDDLGIPATSKIYLDGVNQAGNTYISETSADTVSLVVGASTTMQWRTSDSVTVFPLRIGADAANNAFDDATNGSGSTTCYIGNSTIDVTAPSDESVKKDIVDKEDVLSDLKKIKVKKFKYKQDIIEDGDIEHTGMLAQEVEVLFPEAVYERSDGIKAINYKALIPFIIKAIQELK